MNQKNTGKNKKTQSNNQPPHDGNQNEYKDQTESSKKWDSTNPETENQNQH